MSNNSIFIDSDSIEKDLRRIIVDSCTRNGIGAVFVSCKNLLDIQQAHLKNKLISLKIVKINLDSADDFIFENRDKMLFCVTHDRILSRRLLACGIPSLDKRGRIFDENMGELAVYEKSSLRDREEFSKNFEKLVYRSLS